MQNKNHISRDENRLFFLYLQDLNETEKPMPLNERHTSILAIVNETGSIGVSELAKEFGVSEVTIRKDLTLLEKNGAIYRAHGRAIRLNPYINDRDINIKEKDVRCGNG